MTKEAIWNDCKICLQHVYSISFATAQKKKTLQTLGYVMLLFRKRFLKTRIFSGFFFTTFAFFFIYINTQFTIFMMNYARYFVGEKLLLSPEGQMDAHNINGLIKQYWFIMPTTNREKCLTFSQAIDFICKVSQKKI